MSGIHKEGRGTGEQAMVSLHGQGSFCLCGAYRKCIDEIELLKKEMLENYPRYEGRDA